MSDASTPFDLYRNMLDDSGYQLQKCFEDLPEEAWNAKVAPSALSPSEIAEHLCEVYSAFKTIAQGGKHNWGAYQSGETTNAGRLQKMLALRQEAVAIALASEDPHVHKEAWDYIAAHDCYHVGQLALTRLVVQPDWDGYSIYNYTPENWPEE